MKIILSTTRGGPGGASTMTTEINLMPDVAGDDDLVEAAVREGLNATKVAAEVWNAWSKENETPEQAEMRELQEKAAEQQRDQLRKMLDGGI